MPPRRRTCAGCTARGAMRPLQRARSEPGGPGSVRAQLISLLTDYSRLSDNYIPSGEAWRCMGY